MFLSFIIWHLFIESLITQLFCTLLDLNNGVLYHYRVPLVSFIDDDVLILGQLS